MLHVFYFHHDFYECVRRISYITLHLALGPNMFAVPNLEVFTPTLIAGPPSSCDLPSACEYCLAILHTILHTIYTVYYSYALKALFILSFLKNYVRKLRRLCNMNNKLLEEQADGLISLTLLP